MQSRTIFICIILVHSLSILRCIDHMRVIWQLSPSWRQDLWLLMLMVNQLWSDIHLRHRTESLDRVVVNLDPRDSDTRINQCTALCRLRHLMIKLNTEVCTHIRCTFVIAFLPTAHRASHRKVLCLAQVWLYRLWLSVLRRVLVLMVMMDTKHAWISLLRWSLKWYRGGPSHLLDVPRDTHLSELLLVFLLGLAVSHV